MKQCKIEGCLGKVWSSGLCLRHTPKKPLKAKKKGIKKVTEKQIEKNKVKAQRTKELHAWFEKLWNEEPHYSEISGDFLGVFNSSMYWHHIYPKSLFPEYEFDRENLIRITGNEHAEVEANPTKFEIVNQRREYLKQKYGK